MPTGIYTINIVKQRKKEEIKMTNFVNEMIKVRVSDENGNNGELVWASPVDKFEGVYMLQNFTQFPEYFAGQYVTVDDGNVTGVFVDLEEFAEVAKRDAEKIEERLNAELKAFNEAKTLIGSKVTRGERDGVITGYVPSEKGFPVSEMVTIKFEDGTVGKDSFNSARQIIAKYNKVHG